MKINTVHGHQLLCRTFGTVFHMAAKWLKTG